MASSVKLNALLIGAALMLLTNTLVWFATNTQFIDHPIKRRAFAIALVLSFPITLTAFYSSKYLYVALENSAWAVRFMSFGISWFVFPVLTWVLLGESMLTFKTISCMVLAMLIMAIQLGT